MKRCIAINKMNRNDAGASLVEYTLLVALIAIAGISALNFMGSSVEDSFKTLNLHAFVAAGDICNPALQTCD